MAVSSDLGDLANLDNEALQEALQGALEWRLRTLEADGVAARRVAAIVLELGARSEPIPDAALFMFGIDRQAGSGRG